MDEALQEVATKRVQARFGFVIHAAMYVVMNAGLFLIWWLTDSSYPWFLWPMLGWGIGVLAHGVALVIGPGSAAERHAITRELERLRVNGFYIEM